MSKDIDIQAGNGIRLEYDFVKNAIENTVSEWKQLKLLSTEYINANSKLEIVDEFNYKYSISYSNIIQNYQRNQKFNKFHSKNIFSIHNIRNWLMLNNIDYSLMSEGYKSAKSKLLWECPEGHKFSMNWNNFQSGKRCPECKSSNGEKAITKFLNNNKIKYKREYTFNDCRNINPLPFDFAIFKDYGLFCLIEYDGEQHFNRTGWDSKNDGKLERTILTDTIRDYYCQKNNIKLIRIPYWDFSNLEEILQKELSEVICDAKRYKIIC